MKPVKKEQDILVNYAVLKAAADAAETPMSTIVGPIFNHIYHNPIYFNVEPIMHEGRYFSL
jgi:hypothetical protein